MTESLPFPQEGYYDSDGIIYSHGKHIQRKLLKLPKDRFTLQKVWQDPKERKDGEGYEESMHVS